MPPGATGAAGAPIPLRVSSSLVGVSAVNGPDELAAPAGVDTPTLSVPSTTRRVARKRPPAIRRPCPMLASLSTAPGRRLPTKIAQTCPACNRYFRGAPTQPGRRRRSLEFQPSTSSANVRRVATSPLTSMVVARRLAPGVEIVADLLRRAHECDVLHHGGGDGGRGIVLTTVEVGILDLVGRLLVAHAGEDVEVEVHLLGPHAADVQGEVGTEAVRRRLDVVRDDGGRERQDLEVRGAAPGPGAGEPLVEGRLEGRHRPGGEEDGELAVGDLGGEGDVFRPAPRMIGMSARSGWTIGLRALPRPEPPGYGSG